MPISALPQYPTVIVTSMGLKKREYGGHGGLGDKRWERYSEAFDRVEQWFGIGALPRSHRATGLLRCGNALVAGFHFCDLSFPRGNLQPDMLPANIGPICTEMVGQNSEANSYNGIEDDEKFQPVIRGIQRWATQRNEAMHATSKVLRDETSHTELQQILSTHRSTVESGIILLRAFDILDTESRNKVGKKPATQPDCVLSRTPNG